MIIKNIIEICIAIDISIFSIAYPLCIESIRTIGQKYNSDYLLDVFNNEFPQIQIKIVRNISILQFIIIILFLSLIFKIFPLNPLESFEGNFFMVNSIDILIILLTYLLIFMFIIWINKILIYQGKSTYLIKYLINKYEKSNAEKRKYILKSINEISIYSIKNNKKHLQLTLDKFYLNLFKSINENTKNNEEVSFYDELYIFTNQIIKTYIKNYDVLDIDNLICSAASNFWILNDNLDYKKISRKTYINTWRNALECSKNLNLTTIYWSHAVQFYNFILNSNVYNQNIENDKNKFLELNLTFGGLLYHERKYNKLNYILNFSLSSENTIPFLPESLNDLLYWFEHFTNFYNISEDPIEYKYSFSIQDNAGNNQYIIKNTCLFITLLFVRSIFKFKKFSHTDFENLASDTIKLYNYKNILDFFTVCIEEVLNKNKLLEKLNYKINFSDINNTLNDLNNIINQKIDEVNKINIYELSNININEFIRHVLDQFFKAFNELNFINITNKNLFNDIDIDHTCSTVIVGESFNSLKYFFTSEYKNNDFSNPIYSVFEDNIINSKLKYELPYCFKKAETSSYVIIRSKLIKILNKILKNKKNKKIIAINLKEESINILNNSFKDILVQIPSTNNNLNDILFVIDENDLPLIRFEKIEVPSTKNDNLFVIDENVTCDEFKNLKSDIIRYKFKIYYLFNDFNDIFNHPINKDKFARIQINIDFKLIIEWKKNRNIICINIDNEFKEIGIPDYINMNY